MVLTPSAQLLHDELSKILSSGKDKKKGDTFIDPHLQEKLKSMTAADMLALDPPTVDAGVWTSDPDFCNRLGAHLFGVSVESVRELSWQYLIFFQQIVTANFIRSLDEAAP